MGVSVRESVFIVLCICAQLGHAADTCPEVKIEGLVGSEKITVVQTCPGIPGAKGDQGIPGLKGEKGSSGIVGKHGPAGEKGSTGAPGLSGSAGMKGDMGQPGLLGPPGAKGDGGASGTAGTKGIKGTPGERGPLGTKGDSGSSGLPGASGTPGFPGDRGFPGIPGAPGQPATIGERDLENINCKRGVKDCKQLLQRGIVHSGWYTIYLKGCQPLKVLCDMDTVGGGWIVFQRRADGSVDFFREWNSYKRGFGNQLSEFWLGNDNIHKLTSEGTFELYVYLKDIENEAVFAKYSSFKILSESENYKLILGPFAGGSAGDSLTRHNGAPFSTRDRDNDLLGWSCAEEYKGAWWYTDCHDSNLNALYLFGDHLTHANGINWRSGKGHKYSYKVSEMKIRPVS